MNARQLGLRGGALLFLAFSVLASTPPASAQQAYPNRPIRMIAPAAAGGGTDYLARLIASNLTERFKQQVVVDNRASASGVIAADLTAHAAPDGYTLMIHLHQHTANAALNPKLPYHPVNDFTPITQLTASGFLLAVRPSVPPKNLKEFVQWTRTYKGALNYGSAGIGTGGHLSGALYNMMAGVKAQHIPYKGTAPMLVDLMGGQFQYAFLGLATTVPLARSGKLRAIGVTTPKRLAALPDIPAVAEEVPGFEVVGWYGILGPAKLPKPIIARLHDEMVKILKQPDVRQKILEEGAEPVGNTPEQFRQYLVADLAKWAKFVKGSDAKLF